jgi:phosphoribosyl-ATP pyrophosphohydrolase/phosphoribosyl-AMP cyclohydrolase
MPNIDFDKNGGLVPAILQNANTKQVLMMGYMNREAYDLTVKEGVAWFYSRSKGRLWQKGETSGNVQYVVKIEEDCDNDTLLLQVNPAGPTCHLGTNSCFGDDYFNLNVLERTIGDKIANPVEGSYTNYLVTEGLDKILKKCGEEMTEVVIAAKNQVAGLSKAELLNETSDLLYHLFVLLQNQGIALDEVEAVLGQRHGQSHDYSVRKEIKNY